jgi:hypothetical protein
MHRRQQPCRFSLGPAATTQVPVVAIEQGSEFAVSISEDSIQ